MWSCKHCEKEFNYERNTEKANHSRHCDSNPNKLKSYIKGKESSHKMFENLLGKKKSFSVVCSCCSTTFLVNEREKQFPVKEKYFCSRSCANSLGGKRKAELYHHDGVAHYRTVALRHHEPKCVICSFDKVIAIHHIDENKKNNDPSNLIPLCPNHHEMYHSKWKSEVEPFIKEWQQKFICS
jgi:hypothetical protein